MLDYFNVKSELEEPDLRNGERNIFGENHDRINKGNDNIGKRASLAQYSQTK